MTSSEEPILRIRGLTKRFGGLTALDTIDLDVPRARILSIIGPNGSGKTTFFNCISGIYEPSEGDVRLCRPEGELSLLGLRSDEVTRAGVARTFQTIRLFPMMTVLENVLVGQYSNTRAGWIAAALRLRSFRDEEEKSRVRGRELLAFFGGKASPPGTCPTPTSVGSRSCGRWPPARPCCCWTSPPRA